MPSPQKFAEFLRNFRHLNTMKLEFCQMQQTVEELKSALTAVNAQYQALLNDWQRLDDQRKAEIAALREELLAAQRQLDGQRKQETDALREELLTTQRQTDEQRRQETDALRAELLTAQQQLDEQRRQEIDALRAELLAQQKTVGAELEELLQTELNEQSRCLKRQMGLPARVVFLCELPSLWNSFYTVVTAMLEDSRFEVILVSLWCREYAADGSYVYRRPDFHAIGESLGQPFIEAYDPIVDGWLDLKTLRPDYVFYMRPYDYYRHPMYHIEAVSKYTKTCYIPYGMSIIGGDVERLTLPLDFCSRLYYFFLNNPYRRSYVRELLNFPPNLDDAHFLYLGYPRLDLVRTSRKGTAIETDSFTILWLPRWNTRENNCNFFEYKDVLSKYAVETDKCRLIFRPHPLCFIDFLRTGELSQEELEELKKYYEEEPALELDEKGDYLPSFQASDVLVADETSLIAEYFATGKPIIFCKKEAHFSILMERLSAGIYIVENQRELLETLDSLRRQIDPLKERREALIKADLLQDGKPAGIRIKEEIAKDYLSRQPYIYH